MIKSIRNLKKNVKYTSKDEKDIIFSSSENDICDDYAGEIDFVPALLGEIKSFAVTPFGTYGLCEKRLLRGVVLFGTVSAHDGNGKNKRRFVLDDMTGNAVVETDESMPAVSSTVLVVGTLERRNGINNINAKHITPVPLNKIKTVGVWHTLKAIESTNADIKSASDATELLKTHSFLALIRRSQLSSYQISPRHVLFAVDAFTRVLEE